MSTPREREALEGRITVTITPAKGPTLIFSSESAEDAQSEFMRWLNVAYPDIDLLKRLKKR